MLMGAWHYGMRQEKYECATYNELQQYVRCIVLRIYLSYFMYDERQFTFHDLLYFAK